ncbi:MAG: hypothetical protein RR177_01995 [Oscillospiraceae bacterium]
MNIIDKMPLFFLCANSCNGFVSRLQDAYSPENDWRAYIIKGGPGTGKSTGMKKIASVLVNSGLSVELVPCTGDPGSLDAVIAPEIKVIVMDGTAPHVVEPKYIGATEYTFDFSEAFNKKLLWESRENIIKINAEISVLYKRAYKYLEAAGSLMLDNMNLQKMSVDESKLSAFAESFAKKMLPGSRNAGSEKIRFLSAVTCRGNIFLEDTIKKLDCQKIAVCDEHGICSAEIMKQLRKTALERGYNIITCPCAYFPETKIDHIIIPDKKIAFVTENRFFMTEESIKNIHSRRFTDVRTLRLCKEKMNFNRRTAGELLKNASSIMAEAKVLHDTLESKYIPAVDFEMIDRIVDDIILSIL